MYYSLLFYSLIVQPTDSTVTVPKAATCTTESQTVSLRDNDDPSLYYSPTCTRVKRCGGCCNSALLSCQPTAVEMLNFEVSLNII